MTVLIFCVGSSQPSVTLPHCSEPPSSSAEVTPGPFLVETQILLLRKRLALGICFKCHLKVSPVVGFFCIQNSVLASSLSSLLTLGFEELLP